MTKSLSPTTIRVLSLVDQHMAHAKWLQEPTRNNPILSLIMKGAKKQHALNSNQKLTRQPITMRVLKHTLQELQEPTWHLCKHDKWMLAAAFTQAFFGLVNLRFHLGSPLIPRSMLLLRASSGEKTTSTSPSSPQRQTISAVDKSFTFPEQVEEFVHFQRCASTSTTVGSTDYPRMPHCLSSRLAAHSLGTAASHTWEPSWRQQAISFSPSTPTVFA